MLGRVNASARKIASGCLRAHVGDHPLPEGQRLGVRIVDAEGLYAVLDPQQHDVAQRQPQAGHRVGAVEIDVDDVLIFLRRVLGIFHRAVGPPREPAGMLLEPRVIGRALDREIDRDLETMIARGGDQRGEIVESAELRVDRVVAAVRRADRIRAADVVRRGRQRVVRPLAVGAADRMDRREVERVEAHVTDARQVIDHVGKGAVAILAAAHRAREQLVPGRKTRLQPLGIDRLRERDDRCAADRRRGPSPRRVRPRAAVRRCRSGSAAASLARSVQSISAARRSPVDRAAAVRINASPSA